jgi:hypothetical protein
MELAVLLLSALIMIGAIARFIYIQRAASPPAEARPSRVPLWYREFLRHDFLDPAYQACTLRLEPGADHGWQLSVVFRAAHGAAISQVADPIHDPELDRMGTALACIGWTLAGREGDLAGGVNLRYMRAADAPAKDPPPPDPDFDTTRIKAAQNGHPLKRAQISTVPAGVGLWRVSVGFFPSHANNGRADFSDPLTVPQIFKIIADLKADGWRESRRIYYATHPGTPRYLGAITYVLSRE